MAIFHAPPRQSRLVALLPLFILLLLTIPHTPSEAAPDSGKRSERLATASYQHGETMHGLYGNKSESWGNYVRPGDERWTWDSQQKAWGLYGFTADDKPLELVKQDKRLEMSTR